MEHIVQIGVSVDDDRIEKAVIESATKELKKELRGVLFDDSGWNTGLTHTAERVVKESLEKWKSEIIEKAAEQVADSMKRSKAYREKVKEITA